MGTKIIEKKTKLKGLSKFIVSRLYYDNPQSPLRDSYKRSFLCQQTLYNTGEGLKSLYCKNRWCPTCNRINTSRLILEYSPTLSECENLYFVTLTKPNVKGEELKGEIEDILNTFRKILNSRCLRKYLKQGVIGLRKLECTYNNETDTYHPHLHLLISSRECGEEIIKRWLESNPTSKPVSQDIRECGTEKGKYLEIFKYFSKLIGKDKNTGGYYFNSRVMDIIFNSMKGKRVYGKIGNFKCNPVSSDLTQEHTEEIIKELLDTPTGMYVYRNPQGFIGYYGVRETEGETLIEIPKPQLLTELEQVE